MAATAVSIPSSDSARPTSTDFELHSERGCDKERRAAPQLPSVPPPHSSVGDGADDEGVTLPIWLQQLPAPAACVFHFLYFDVIDARDDYHTMLRKCALAFAPLAAAAMLVLFVMDIASGAFSEDAGLGRVLAALSPPLSAVVFLVGFVIVRVSPAHNRAAIDFLLFGTLATNVVSAISDVTYPVWATSLMVAIVPLLVRSPRAPIVHLVCAAVFVISTYNRGQLPIDVEAAAQRSLAAVPDPYFRASAAARVAPCVNVGIFAIMALVVVASIVRETERRETAAKASLDVAAAIADALLDYDTTLARRVIDEARGSHTADNALLERFVVIVANLDRYRPHLPNWLVRDVSVDGHRDTHSAVATRTRRGSTTAISRADSSSTLHSVYGARSLSEDDGGATTPKGVNRIRTAARPEQTNGRFGAASIEPGTPFKARVALAEVAFAIPSASELRDARGLPDVAAAVPLMAAAGHAFVDRVHRLAGGTSGAVHAFVGDVARVSWNAAAKAVQPEAKAARFLARLKHDAGHELVRAWGAAATGDARVQLAGSRQQALLVTASGGGAEALRAGLRVAARHGAFVVDGTTYAGARHAVRFRGCGVTRRTPLNVNRVDEACPLAPDSKNDAANDDIDLDAVEASQLTALSSLHPSALPSSTPPSGPAIAPDRVVVSSPTHRMHAHDVAPMYYLPPRRARIGLFSVVEEEAADSGDWLYVLDPASAGGAKSDAATASARSIDALTCLAVQHAAAGDHAAALELLDDVAHSGTADPMIVEFVAELAAQY